MPYANVNELPTRIRKYSPKIQRMWLSTFNSTWKKLTKEGKPTKEKEGRSFMSANATIKKRLEQYGSCRYTENTVMEFLIDKFVGNFDDKKLVL